MNKGDHAYFGIHEYESDKSRRSYFKKLVPGNIIVHTSLLRSRTVVDLAYRQQVICDIAQEGSEAYKKYGDHTVIVIENLALKEQTPIEPVMFDVDNLVGM